MQVIKCDKCGEVKETEKIQATPYLQEKDICFDCKKDLTVLVVQWFNGELSPTR